MAQSSSATRLDYSDRLLLHREKYAALQQNMNVLCFVAGGSAVVAFSSMVHLERNSSVWSVGAYVVGMVCLMSAMARTLAAKGAAREIMLEEQARIPEAQYVESTSDSRKA